MMISMQNVQGLLGAERTAFLKNFSAQIPEIPLMNSCQKDNSACGTRCGPCSNMTNAKAHGLSSDTVQIAACLVNVSSVAAAQHAIGGFPTKVHTINHEAVETYPIWPYEMRSLYADGNPIGQNTQDYRRYGGSNTAWDYSAGLVPAILGGQENAELAYSATLQRVGKTFDGSQFPGYALTGCCADGAREMENTGIVRQTLQKMLLTADNPGSGSNIYLLPTWPRKRDVSFSLRAPLQTTVTVEYKAGKISSLVVTPASRRADLVMPDGIPHPASPEDTWAHLAHYDSTYGCSGKNNTKADGCARMDRQKSRLDCAKFCARTVTPAGEKCTVFAFQESAKPDKNALRGCWFRWGSSFEWKDPQDCPPPLVRPGCNPSGDSSGCLVGKVKGCKTDDNTTRSDYVRSPVVLSGKLSDTQETHDVEQTKAGCCEAFIGHLRIQTLSPTLIRVEPEGPMGFEDRPTFMVVDRSFIGVPILSKTNTSNSMEITTRYYSVLVKTEPVSVRVTSIDGTVIYESISAPASNLLHWPSPLSTVSYALEDRPRFFVPEWGPEPMPETAHVDPVLRGTNGYDFRNNVTGDVYVFLLGPTLDSWFSSRGEFLRLTGPTPLLPDYAYGTWFTNWEQYNQSRAMYEVEQWETGKFPLDVWGMDMNWRNTTCGARPVDHWMNCGWQSNSSSTHSKAKHNLSSTCEDHYYNHPNTLLVPNFTSWFGFLERKGVHTYFNDHPFPVDYQTTPKETAFRWQGLTAWISKGQYTSTAGRGLAFWWFDHNWGFTLPPPFTPPFEVKQHSAGEGDATFAVPWQNLTAQVWGSHIYYETTKRINALSGIAERPIALTRDNGPAGWGTSNTSWPANDSTRCVPGSAQCGSSSAVPAHHRFPVWWTGDGVPLLASLETMVDESVHDFRPFVHSDCGGHQGNASGEAHSNAMMRWTAHCAFGTIHRFHQGEHRPWLYPNSTQDVVRKYLQARYALSPSIIAAGQLVQEQGFPPVARCDLTWPEHPEARSNHQYIHLGDTLMAPLEEQESDRAVWIPPGDWQDAWDGSIVTGPRTINVTKPFAQIPMWHRKGGIMITTDSKAQRISEQDWSELTLHAFPSEVASVSIRRLIAKEGTTVVTIETDESDIVSVRIVPPGGGVSRAWHLRVHLAPTQRVATLFIDGVEMLTDTVQHIEPSKNCTTTFPFEGVGAAPACKAGPVAEVFIPASTAPHNIRLTLA